MTTKKNLIAILLFLLVLAGSNVLTYALVKNHDENRIPKQAKPLSDTAIDIDSEKVPEGALSPTAVVQKSDDYIDREIKVYGKIIKTNDNKFMIIGLETQNPGAIEINNSKAKVNLNELMSNSAKPVTIIGQLEANPPSLQLKISTLSK